MGDLRLAHALDAEVLGAAALGAEVALIDGAGQLDDGVDVRCGHAGDTGKLGDGDKAHGNVLGHIASLDGRGGLDVGVGVVVL